MGDTNPLTGVSGPGKFSVREDLPPSQNYGDRKMMQEDIAGAPLSSTPNQRPMPANEIRNVAIQARPTGLYDTSSRPNEPVTTGADVGPGLGSNSLMMAKPADDSRFRMSIESSKPILAYIADLPNTSPETRAAIKELWNM